MIQKLVLGSNAKRIGYFSTYPPRECGIANFTKDLIDSICEIDDSKPSIIAINEKGAIYDYDRRVKFKIDRDDKEDYVKAAEYVNSSNIRLLVVQHEFGLYGGDYGEYIKLFLDHVKKPVITTLHTVQPDFDRKAIEALRYIVERRFATLVRNHGLRRSRYLRIRGAKVHITMANIACNIVRMVSLLLDSRQPSIAMR